ncbi:TPA: hypothetical protein ACKRNQ_002789 [Pseudomonas aeruginosa]
MFDAPRKNELTQGTIFSCAYAENYNETSAYGITLTARCDASQDKAPIYNFIPIVPLGDWIIHDGAEIVLKRAESDAANTKKNIILQAGLSESLIRTKSSEEIINGHLLPKASADKGLQKKLQQFKEQDQIIAEITAAISSDRRKITDTLKKFQKHIDTTIKELAGNRLTGYYLLRSMPSLYDDSGSDYVALLREVHHIPRSLAQRIISGVSKAEWESQPDRELTKCPVFYGDDDYCVPVARLQSPWIEHLMQSWTLLFSRIGVEDIDASSVRKSLATLGI